MGNKDLTTAIMGKLERLSQKAKQEVEQRVEQMTEKLLGELEHELKRVAPSAPTTRKKKLKDSFTHEQEYKKGQRVWKLKNKPRQGNKVFLLEYGHRVANVKQANKKRFVTARPFFNVRKDRTIHEFIRRTKKIIDEI